MNAGDIKRYCIDDDDDHYCLCGLVSAYAHLCFLCPKHDNGKVVMFISDLHHNEKVFLVDTQLICVLQSEIYQLKDV